MINVLVADDSATARALLVSLLSAERGIRVVGEAKNGREAVDMADRLSPDVITMDIQMPEWDGFRATQEIMTRNPRPIIIVSSAARTDDVKLSLEATRAGALMVIPKPGSASNGDAEVERRYLVNMVRAMSQVKVVRRHGVRDMQASPVVQKRVMLPTGTAPRLIAIAASTGGPVALQVILSALPKTLSVPVLVVQHIAHGFTPGFAKWLATDAALPIQVATFGEHALAGRVYIAPDNQHLGIRLAVDGSLRLLLDASPPIGAFRPSATFLFRSAVQALGSSMIGVILTGMGDDGVAGLADVHSAKGYVIAQDEASSVIYGMPREATLAGVVDCVLPVSHIAAHLVQLTS